MGSIGTHRPKGMTNAEFFQHELLRNAEGRILPGAATIGGAFYAAVETPGREPDAASEVWALIVKFHWSPRAHINFTYKAMDETVMPYFFDAPASVLDRLTSTDRDTANTWRSRCRQALERKARVTKALSGLQDGDELVMRQMLAFSDGRELRTFVVRLRRDRAGRRQVMLTSGGRQYRIPRWREYVAMVKRRDGKEVELLVDSLVSE